MTATRFRAEFKKNLPLQRALFRYTHLLMTQISQTAACNCFHKGGSAPCALPADDRQQPARKRISPYAESFGAYAGCAGIRRHQGCRRFAAKEFNPLQPWQHQNSESEGS